MPISAWAKDPDQDNNVKVYKKVAPATVFIASAHVLGHTVAGEGGKGIGSGVFVDTRGTILTNAHVVEGAIQIMAVLYDGTKVPAEVVGTDPVTDLALLRVELPKGPHATIQFGDSDRVEVGQKVLAIGHPFGLGYALTTGVVSGFVSTPETAALFQERVIQTSAAINPGNSGGPLVDSEGRVIGINSAMLAGAQNIGFAIPINTVKSVMAELQAKGRVARPWLGVTGKLLTEEVVQLFALPLVKGLLVTDVTDNSPAQRLGLRPGSLSVAVKGEPWVLGGDILVAVDGHDVKTAEQYVKVFKQLSIGQTIDLTIMRNGRLMHLVVTLEERPKRTEVGQPVRTPEKVEFRPLVGRMLRIPSFAGDIDF